LFLAQIKQSIQSTEKNPAYRGRALFVVQPLCPDGISMGQECVALDYIGAGIGDLVLCGSAPGLAREVLHMGKAPIRTLIMGIVDTIDFRDISE
jgi:ethanolamine utilization protein EutN